MIDEYFMRIAIREAEIAYSRNQLPIGAVLVISKKIVGTNGNAQIMNNDRFHHAENILIEENSGQIKRASKEGKNIELYTSLEPCLMCLGAAVHNRLTRIVFSCPNPAAGSSSILPSTKWYAEKWPKIIQGPFCEESYNLFVKFMEKNPESWSNVLPLYKEM